MLNELLDEFQNNLVINFQGTIDEKIVKAFRKTIMDNFETIAVSSEITKRELTTLSKDRLTALRYEHYNDCLHLIGSTIKDHKFYRKIEGFIHDNEVHCYTVNVYKGMAKVC